MWQQFGFRKNKLTILALIDFVNDCIEAMDPGELLLGCITNLSKAFDFLDARLVTNNYLNSVSVVWHWGG